MSGFRFSFPACVIAGKGHIDRHDFLILRKYAFADGIRTYDDALVLLAMNDMCPSHCVEWRSYFIEALTSLIVDSAPPSGRLDPLKSAWLIRVLAYDCVIDNPLHLELLLHAMECADSVPDMLSAFALDQLRFAMLEEPCGAYSTIRPRQRGITAHDLVHVWRILRRSVTGGRLVVSPLEASILHAIDDLVKHRDNYPGWSEVIEHITSGEAPRTGLREQPWLLVPDFASGVDDALATSVRS